jgi:hypothetical protein
MVELCPLPLSGVVASGASLREAGCRVVRISGDLEILQMAGRTLGRKDRRILVAHMALGTGNIDVCAGQREVGQRVVEFGAQPLGRRVTGIALSGKMSFAVVRIISFFVIRCVAAIAVGRSPGKLACDMTGGAIHLCVSSSQRELRKLVVIKECPIPGGHRMAERTVVR